jgi:hypothetical protein
MAEKLACPCIQGEVTVDDSVVKLVLVLGHDDDVKFPGRHVLGAARPCVSVRVERSSLSHALAIGAK